MWLCALVLFYEIKQAKTKVQFLTFQILHPDGRVDKAHQHQGSEVKVVC